MCYLHLPTTISKIQLTYRTTIIQNHLSGRPTTKSIKKKPHIETGRRRRDGRMG